MCVLNNAVALDDKKITIGKNDSQAIPASVMGENVPKTVVALNDKNITIGKYDSQERHENKKVTA